MTSKAPPPAPPTPYLEDASALLQALETLREELGGAADDIITVLREAGVSTPGPASKTH